MAGNMDKAKIDRLLVMLDGNGSDSEFRAVVELRKLGQELPTILREKYHETKNWGARSSLVYHAIRYSREVEDAVQLGLEALSDRSKHVRYRACMLLAYSLNKSALEKLKELATNSKDPKTVSDAIAAIDAIEEGNSDYFLDRDHSGKIKLRVN